MTLHVTWLADDELGTMHETEQPGVNYHYARLDGIDLAIDGGARLDSVYAYLSVHGAALDRGGQALRPQVAVEQERRTERHPSAEHAKSGTQDAIGLGEGAGPHRTRKGVGNHDHDDQGPDKHHQQGKEIGEFAAAADQLFDLRLHELGVAPRHPAGADPRSDEQHGVREP